MSGTGILSGGGANPLVDKKPNIDPDRVDLKVTGEDGVEISFKMRRESPLSKLMNAYCEQRAVAANTFVFLHDGKIINANQTPQQLNMENGDDISAMLHLHGGCNWIN